jgi:hypothetical protein
VSPNAEASAAPLSLTVIAVPGEARAPPKSPMRAAAHAGRSPAGASGRLNLQMLLDMVMDLFLGMVGTGRSRRPRMPPGPPEPRPRWWRTAAAVAVLAELLPVLAGLWLTFRVAREAAGDDLLFVVGMVGLVAVCVLAGLALALVLAAVSVARVVLTGRAGARAQVLVAGVAGMATGVVVLSTGLALGAALWLACAGAAATILGVLAPAPEGAGEPPLV